MNWAARSHPILGMRQKYLSPLSHAILGMRQKYLSPLSHSSR